MRDAKRVPQDDICVLDILVPMLFNPLRETLRRFARCLGDMSACGMDLIVLI